MTFLTGCNKTLSAPALFELSGKRIYVAGHKEIAGHKEMMGSAVVRRLADERPELAVADKDVLDLTNQEATEDWLAHEARCNFSGCGPGRRHPSSCPAKTCRNKCRLRTLL